MNFWKTIVLILFCFVLVSVSYAQSETPPTPEILKRVLTLEGKWEAKVSMQIGGRSYSFRYFMHYRKTADGNGLYMDESATIPDVGKLIGGNIIGYDPYDKKLHWFSVDNFGTTHDHIGQLVDNDHLRLVHESQREGKIYKEEIDFLWKSPKQLHVKLVGTLDGQIEETLEGTFVRKSQK
jgi:hypothetical protein